jgi:hypothetical protein
MSLTPVDAIAFVASAAAASRMCSGVGDDVDVPISQIGSGSNTADTFILARSRLPGRSFGSDSGTADAFPLAGSQLVGHSFPGSGGYSMPN